MNASSNTAASVKILIADDNEEALFALRELLERKGYQVVTASTGTEALKKIEAELPDLALLDVVMPGLDGYQVTKAVKADALLRYIPVVLCTSKDDLEDILKGLENGADDYVKKPYRQEELIARVHAALRTRALYLELQRSEAANRELSHKVGERYSFAHIIGKSSAMQAVYDLIEKVSASHLPVLITGESGTGKELVASALHYQSPRKNRPFVIQNCSAFNEQLLESELFGHVKGAFTGAIRDKQGLFEAADGGTFFLDELGEMSPALQVKLLRVLQDGTFTPVGGTKPKKVDVRIVAATNRNVDEMVAKGSFREDLYYRLNVVNVKLPPLRERKVDIPLLVDYFLEQYVKRHGGEKKLLSTDALLVLADYGWPGNIRELQNELERLIVMSGKDTQITADLISPRITQGISVGESASAAEGKLKDAIEKLEREMIRSSMERNGGNKSEVSRELGISRSNLIAKVQAYGLEKSAK